MKSFNQFFTLTALSLMVCACGGGGSSATPQGKSATLSIKKDNILNIGNTVTLGVDCDNCENIQYKWTFDINNNGQFGDTVLIDDVPVSDKEFLANSYTLLQDDFGVKLKIDVNATINGVSHSEYVVYQPSIAEGIYTSTRYLAVKKTDNSLVSWLGGSQYIDKLDDIKTVFETEFGFAANKTDGEFVTWGASKRQETSPEVSNVTHFFSNQGGAFAALKADGTVITWGSEYAGGNSQAISDQLVNVKKIYSAKNAFTALKADKTVVSWGAAGSGGDNSSVNHLLVDVEKIAENEVAFAAVKGDKSVVTWGELNFGGHSDHIRSELVGVSGVYSNRTKFYQTYQNGTDFIAIKDNGDVISWGADVYSSGSLKRVKSIPGAKEAFTTWGAVAVLTQDGNVEIWGDLDVGGDASQLDGPLSGVKTIVANANAFSALKYDGSIINWGTPGCGGENSTTKSLTGIIEVVASECSFVARNRDGGLVAWGDHNRGGNMSAVEAQLKSTKLLKATQVGFIALQNDGSVLVWGYDSELSPELQSLLEPNDYVLESSF